MQRRGRLLLQRLRGNYRLLLLQRRGWLLLQRRRLLHGLRQQGRRVGKKGWGLLESLVVGWRTSRRLRPRLHISDEGRRKRRRLRPRLRSTGDGRCKRSGGRALLRRLVQRLVRRVEWWRLVRRIGRWRLRGCALRVAARHPPRPAPANNNGCSAPVGAAAARAARGFFFFPCAWFVVLRILPSVQSVFSFWALLEQASNREQAERSRPTNGKDICESSLSSLAARTAPTR